MMGGLFLTLLMAHDWQLDYRIGPTTTQVTDWVSENSNHTTEPQTISVTFNYALTKKIWDTADESPPWTKPFTTLPDVWILVSHYEYPFHLAPGKRFIYYITSSRNTMGGAMVCLA
jgi:hypothetical protein